MDCDNSLIVNNMRLSLDEMIDKANDVRSDVIAVCVKNGAGHIAPSLSCIDILVVLYYGVMNLTSDPTWSQRDRLILSKAHGCYGLYSILSDLGYVAQDEWEAFYQGSPLSGCCERSVERGIEASCGSLGHGLPIAVGIAFGAKLRKQKYKVYCVVGDGEMQEGSNWEAIQFAVKHELSNLMIIIDNNGLQAMDRVDNVLTCKERPDDLVLKLDAFGVNVKQCDGHDIEDMLGVFQACQNEAEGLRVPAALDAKTIKGYGLQCMENVAKFHYRLPTEAELKMGNRYD